ncbi:hypothetical protein AB7281_08075 [Providencia rettgeri]
MPIILFIFYGLIFGSPVTFLPSYLNLTNIVVVLSLFLLIKFNVKFNLKKISFYFIPLFLYLAYDFFLFRFDDTSFYVQAFRLVGINLASYIVAYIAINYYSVDTIKLYKYLSLFIVLSCLISILSIPYNDIQKTINLIIKPNMNEGVLDYINNFRFNGLTGLSGSELSLVYSIFFIYYTLFIGKGVKRSIILNIGAVIVIIGILIVGRTGLISAFICFALMSIYLKKYSAIIYSSIAISIFIFLSFVIYTYSYQIPEEIRSILLWAFEPIYKGLFMSELSGSNDVLVQMWYLPKNDLEVLFGIGSWGELIVPPGSFYKPDPGYMRMMYQHGVIIEFIGLCILVSSIFVLKKGVSRFIYFILLIIALLLNFKEIYLYRDPLFALLSITYYVSVNKKTKNQVYHD